MDYYIIVEYFPVPVYYVVPPITSHLQVLEENPMVPVTGRYSKTMIPTVNIHRPFTTINCPVCSGIVTPTIVSEELFDISASAEIEVKCPHCKRRFLIVCRPAV